jgi:NTE family protein
MVYKFKKSDIADCLKMSCLFRFIACCSFVVLLAGGCAHYTVNPPLDQYDPDAGYRRKNNRASGSMEDLGLYLTFSGGGTRAAAFSYGVLEELKNTEITIKGEKHRLLDEVESISGVSGGSFTAAYFGLFGDRIFEDYEEKFLNKNIQGAILIRTLFNPYNWIRLMSATFTRSDIATEYYDNYVFEGGTFGDIAAMEGPMVMINATDMISGIRLGFNQGGLMYSVRICPISR